MKNKFLFIALALIGLLGCKDASNTKQPSLEIGQIKVAILYPNEEDATFDMDYYEQRHMPMMARFLGDNLLYYEIDQVISGRTPDAPSPYLAIGYFYVKDRAQYHATIAKHIDSIVGDFQNYTNVRPVVQVSEIKQLQGYQ